MAQRAEAGRTRLERLIDRVDHNFFHGFVVQVKRGGQRWDKYFSDKPDGAIAALRCARDYRDRLVKQLPPATKIKRTNSLNTTGVIGVVLARDRTRAGNTFERYIALWPRKGTRRPGKKSFSVAKYGKREARRLAVEARRKGIAQYLNSLR